MSADIAVDADYSCRSVERDSCCSCFVVAVGMDIGFDIFHSKCNGHPVVPVGSQNLTARRRFREP